MKTYCSKCLRTSEIVDMSDCPFCKEIICKKCQFEDGEHSFECEDYKEKEFTL